jgi:hypothetical protein
MLWVYKILHIIFNVRNISDNEPCIEKLIHGTICRREYRIKEELFEEHSYWHYPTGTFVDCEAGIIRSRENSMQSKRDAIMVGNIEQSQQGTIVDIIIPAHATIAEYMGNGHWQRRV